MIVVITYISQATTVTIMATRPHTIFRAEGTECIIAIGAVLRSAPHWRRGRRGGEARFISLRFSYAAFTFSPCRRGESGTKVRYRGASLIWAGGAPTVSHRNTRSRGPCPNVARQMVHAVKVTATKMSRVVLDVASHTTLGPRSAMATMWKQYALNASCPVAVRGVATHRAARAAVEDGLRTSKRTDSMTRKTPALPTSSKVESACGVMLIAAATTGEVTGVNSAWASSPPP